MPTHTMEKFCSSLYQEAKETERSELKSHILLQGHFFRCYDQKFLTKKKKEKKLKEQRGLFLLIVTGFSSSYQRSQGMDFEHLVTSVSPSGV